MFSGDSDEIRAVATAANGFPADDPRAWPQAAVPREHHWMDEASRIVARNYFAAIRPWMERETRADIEAWIATDKLKRPDDAGTSAGGRYYVHMKDEMLKKLLKLDVFSREFFKQQLLGNPWLQEWLRNEAMAEQFELVDSIIREHYPTDHGMLFEPKYNHKFLTEASHTPDAKAGILSIDNEQIIDLFRGRNPEEFPRVIVTSSHAQGETERDVRNITEGPESLARDSWADAEHPHGIELNHGFVDQGIAPGQTLSIYACDVHESPWRNGAALLRRVNELKRIERTGEIDQFYHISPGAVRIAKLILACMVEKDEDVRAIAIDDWRPTAALQSQRSAPIRLRADAVEIANHFQLVGYSKGGNVVSDAMRYLVHELISKRADGQDLFEVHPQSPDIADGSCAMTQQNVYNILHGIGCMALASVEVAMNEFYKAFGVQRESSNNREDIISAHHNFTSSRYDLRWIINGVEDYLGHAPQHKMGRRRVLSDSDREEAEIRFRGYALDDPRFARRMRECTAQHYGKAAIAHLHIGESLPPDEVIIEAAPGTTLRMLAEKCYQGSQAGANTPQSFLDKIERAVGVLFKDVSLEPVKGRSGFLRLKCPGADFTRDLRSLQKLEMAFKHLRNPQQKGLVVADMMIQEDIGIRIKALSGRSAA